MKTKRINRLTALVLAIVMLSSLVTLPVFAEGEEEKEGLVFANVDFEDAAVNQEEVPPPEGSPEGTLPTYKDGTSITATGIKSAHPFVSIGEDEEHGKYAIIPFRGLTEDGKSGSGNFDKVLTISHGEVSYETTQGVNFEFDFFAQHVKIEGESSPTVEFQFQSINHEPINDTPSTSWVSFGTINLATGEFKTNAVIQGSATIDLTQWNNIRFELDLKNGTFAIYVNDVKFADYGTIGNGNAPVDIVVPAGKLLIAKCNKNKGAYNNDDSVADTEMTYVAVDNIKFYENVDFIPPKVEEKPQYSISYDSYQTRTVGVSPKTFGYPAVPSSAVVAVDPTDPSNNAIRVDLAAVKSNDYFLWHSSNAYTEAIEANADYDPNDPENHPKYTIVDGVMTASTKQGKITAPIWGDDEGEDCHYNEIPASYVIESLAGVQANGKSGSWYLVTGEMRDAYYGSGNVGTGLQVKHPTLLSENYKTVVINVDYYFSEDAAGTIEVQMNGYFCKKDNPVEKSALAWIDTVQIKAVKDSDVLQIKSGSNYLLVCGSAPYLKKGEWFTMSVVFDMETGWEDIYFNGSYCYTMSPKTSYKFGSTDVNIEELKFHSINTDDLSVGKIVRNTYPGALNGFYMVDNVNFSTGEVLQGADYEKTFIENFDSFEIGATDFADSEFALDIPSSVVLAGDDTHAKALKMTVGEVLDPAIAEAPVLFRSGNNADDKLLMVAKVYDNKSVLLTRDLPAGEEAPEEAPANAVKPNARGIYTVDGVGGYTLSTYGTYVNYWGKLEDGSDATNVNKSWIFHNAGISYALKSRVATDIELFIPEEASGILTSQIKKGAGTNAIGTKDNFEDLDLYAIDLATGNINLGATVSNTKFMGTLNKGEWNTVSLAVNLLTGDTVLYVNNVSVGEGNIGYSDVAFYENNWIPVKIASEQDPKKNPLEGYVMIDDVRFFTVTNQMITVDSSMENVVEVNFGGEVVADGTKLFITEDVRCTCESVEDGHACGKYFEKRFDTSAYLDVVTSYDQTDYLAAVRSNLPIGLRFVSYVDTELLDELLAEYEGTVTYGTVIVPSSTVATVADITRPELALRGIEYLDVRTDSFFSNQYLEEEMEYDLEGCFAGSIVGLKEANIMRDFTAVGYVEIALSTGGSIVIYSDVMQENLATLAQQYLDESDEIPADIKTVLDAFAIGRYPQGYDDGLRDDVAK